MYGRLFSYGHGCKRSGEEEWRSAPPCHNPRSATVRSEGGTLNIVSVNIVTVALLTILMFLSSSFSGPATKQIIFRLFAVFKLCPLPCYQLILNVLVKTTWFCDSRLESYGALNFVRFSGTPCVSWRTCVNARPARRVRDKKHEKVVKFERDANISHAAKMLDDQNICRPVTRNYSRTLRSLAQCL